MRDIMRMDIKMLQRSLEDDIQDLVLDTVVDKNKDSKTKIAQFLEMKYKAIVRKLGLNTSVNHEFMVSLTIKIIESSIKSKEAYQYQMNKIKKRGETKGSSVTYENYYDKQLMRAIISMYILGVQVAIPPVKTHKTIPGCVMSLSGYPLEDDTSDKNILNYIVCSFLKIRTDRRPWANGLPNIRVNKSARDVAALKNYVKKQKDYFAKWVLSIPEIQNKIFVKKRWMLQNVNELEVPREFSLNKWVGFTPPLQKINDIRDGRLTETYKSLLSRLIRTGSYDQFDKLNKKIGVEIGLSAKIHQIVNKIASRKEMLFITNYGVPYIENACCNDKNGNVYDYFVENESGTKIDKYNRHIKNINEITDRVTRLGKPKTLFTDAKTKVPHSIINKNFTEETIYMAFIKHCKFNSGLTLDDELATVCDNNTASFNKYDDIKEKISVLKTENGASYDIDSFNRLMRIINKRNKVVLEKNKYVNVLDETKQSGETKQQEKNSIYLSKTITVLDMIIEDEEILTDKDVLGEIKRYLEENFEKHSAIKLNAKNEESKKLQSIEEKVSDMINIITFKIDNIKETLNEFFASQSTGNSFIRNVNKFLDKLQQFSKIGDEYYMDKIDNTNYFTGQFLKNMITDMSITIPEIIIHSVDYSEKYVPKHWKLSEKHVKDIMKIMADEYKDYQKVYSNQNFKKYLDMVTKANHYFTILADNMVFLTNIINDKYIVTQNYSSKIYLIIMKYIFMSVLENYVLVLESNYNKVNEIMRVRSDAMNEEEKLIESARKDSDIQSIKKCVMTVIKTMLRMVKTRKKHLNLSKDKIKSNVLKSKVKEKSGITERLRNMTAEQRKIENLLKNHKLGDWNIGQTRAIFEYSDKQYDKERNEIEKAALLEYRMGRTDDVTMAHGDIYELEYLEQQSIANREEREALALDMRDEDERDGEELW